MNRGIAYACIAFVVWGVFPVYFKLLSDVPVDQILAHRIVWSLAFVAIALLAGRNWGWLRAVAAAPRMLLWFAGSTALILANWGLFIWAVNAGHVVDASLGYFINPLVVVLLGVLVLHERLRPLQWIAVGIAALGVGWLTWLAGHLPWIGLALALTFGVYGLLRKTAALGALEGLALETGLLFPFALGFLAWRGHAGTDVFLSAGPAQQALLVLAGPLTAAPLLLFAAGARRIPLSALGILQYIAPTLQLACGVWLYHEAFPAAKAAGYAAIWVAFVLFTGESLWQLRRRGIVGVAGRPLAGPPEPSAQPK